MTGGSVGIVRPSERRQTSAFCSRCTLCVNLVCVYFAGCLQCSECRTTCAVYTALRASRQISLRCFKMLPSKEKISRYFFLTSEMWPSSRDGKISNVIELPAFLLATWQTGLMRQCGSLTVIRHAGKWRLKLTHRVHSDFTCCVSMTAVGKIKAITVKLRQSTTAIADSVLHSCYLLSCWSFGYFQVPDEAPDCYLSLVVWTCVSSSETEVLRLKPATQLLVILWLHV